MRKNAPFDISDELLEKMSKKEYIKKLHSDCPMTHIQTLSGRFTITVEREYGLQRVYSMLGLQRVYARQFCKNSLVYK